MNEGFKGIITDDVVFAMTRMKGNPAKPLMTQMRTSNKWGVLSLDASEFVRWRHRVTYVPTVEL
jgi:hypothetical protein